MFNLRQLQRRETPMPWQTDDSPSRPSIDRNSVLTCDRPPFGDGRGLCHDISPHGFNQSTSSLNPHFYRPPRPPIPTAPGEMSRFFDNRSQDSGLLSPSTTPSITDWPTGGIDSEGLLGQTVGQSSDSASVASKVGSSRPLGPRWDDYSFRKVDLIFAAPPPDAVTPTSPPQLPSTPSLSVKERTPNWSLISLWNFVRQKSTVKEQGFSVQRPNRVPHRVSDSAVSQTNQ